MRAAGAVRACATLPPSASVPVLVLAGDALGVDEPGRFGRYAEPCALVLGGITAALAVATAIAMAYGARLKPSPLTPGQPNGQPRLRRAGCGDGGGR